MSLNNLELGGVSLSKDEEGAEYLKEVGVLSRFLSSSPGLDIADQRDLLMAGVLQCSSIGSSQCLDALICEYTRSNSRYDNNIEVDMESKINKSKVYQHFSYNDVEKDTITMVLFHLLSSRHIGDEVKSRIRIAAGLGKKDHCSLYTCQLNLPHSLPFA